MAESLDHQNFIEIRPFSGITNYEKRERASIESSTHKDLLDLRRHYTASLRTQEALKQKGENPPEMMREIFTRLLEEVKQSITEREMRVKEKAQKSRLILTGEVPPGYKAEPIKLLPGGKVSIGYRNTIPGDTRNEGGVLRSSAIVLSYDEFLQNISGKTIQVDDMILTLSWVRGTPQLHISKNTPPRKEQASETPQPISTNSEKMESLRKAQLILADLRRKIITDTSPLATKIFQGKRPRDFELAHMTYASGDNESNIRYAQVMEDRGRVYSAWGEVSGGSRPLILVDQRNAKMLFSGKVDQNNVIIPDPGFQWPESRDKSAYRFQPVINFKWTR